MKQLHPFLNLALISLFLLCLQTSIKAQVNLVSFAQTSAGGHASNDISLDFSVGQITSFPIEEPTLSGNVGVLQLITDLISSQDDQEIENLSIYPNPVSDKLIIDSDCSHSLDLQLYQMDGKLILHKENIKCTESIDVGHLSQGHYTLRISENNQINNYKLIKI